VKANEGEQVREQRYRLLGWTAAQAAAWLGVHERTLRRIETGETRRAGPVLRALTLKAGELGALHTAWGGWRLAPDGRLYPPGYRYGFVPGDILAEYFRIQLTAELQRQVRKLRAQNRKLARRTRRNEGPRYW
jgi:DNA-binding XRE family transcriptional regulator